MITRKIFPIGLSMTVHGPDELCDVKGQWFREKIHTCDLVVCISHFARSQVMYHSDHAHWHKAVVCRLGVTSPWLGMASARLGRPLKEARKLRMLCVGRLTPAKGQRQLVDAVHQLCMVGYDVELDLIGDGPDRPALEQAISGYRLTDRVHLLGLKNQIEVRQAMQEADVFALPSFAEGVPVALMEAMAAGVPVLSTRIAGIAELINPRTTGCLIHAGDHAGLVKELAWLADNPDMRQQMAVEAEKFVQANYNLDRNIPTLSGIFENHLQGKEPCADSKPSFVAG